MFLIEEGRFLINFIVVPYRDESFLSEFGPIVRDWHIISALCQVDLVNRIYVINRPGIVFENVIRNKNGSEVLREFFPENYEKIEFLDSVSLDVNVVKGRREWTGDNYPQSLKSVINRLSRECNSDLSDVTIFLDFTPTSIFDVYDLKNKFLNFFSWYDAIDNFTKHNRFSEKEKCRVSSKYEYVNKGGYDLVTGVSPKISANLNNLEVLSNGLVPISINEHNSAEGSIYDFGFCGFVTDKLDIEFISYIVDLGFSVVVWGKAYNKDVSDSLRSLGVAVKGKFDLSLYPEVFSSFKVGLVPYILEKSHDESPLKIYEYLRHGRPVLSAQKYEVESPYVDYYLNDYPSKEKLKRFLAMNAVEVISKTEKIIDEVCWRKRIQSVLDKV